MAIYSLCYLETMHNFYAFIVICCLQMQIEDDGNVSNVSLVNLILPKLLFVTALLVDCPKILPVVSDFAAH